MFPLHLLRCLLAGAPLVANLNGHVTWCDMEKMLTVWHHTPMIYNLDKAQTTDVHVKLFVLSLCHPGTAAS